MHAHDLEFVWENVVSWDHPRCAIVLAHQRPALLEHVTAAIAPQVNYLIVVDNASDPPLNPTQPEVDRYELVRDPTQPPNLARMWNQQLDRISHVMEQKEVATWDVAVLCDDAIAPPGWFDAVADGLRAWGAGAASTHSYHPVVDAYLLTQLTNGGDRMCPWAFILPGERGLRADETMRWWYCDTDLDWQARQSGGTVVVPGQVVRNERIGDWTNRKPELGAQAHADGVTFNAKWGL